MKKVFSVLATVALLVFVFSSCNPPQKTYADYLTQQTKGWKLVAATSSPDYLMSDDVTRVADLFDGYLHEWEKDYVIVFNENGSEIVKPGKTPVPEGEQGYDKETSLGNWSIQEGVVLGGVSYDFLNMYIPFVFDQNDKCPLNKCKILTLNDDKMVVKFDFTDDPITAKGRYEWTLTYEPAK